MLLIYEKFSLYMKLDCESDFFLIKREGVLSHDFYNI